MHRAAVVIVAAAAALGLAGCGAPAATNAPLVFKGALTGVYHPGPPATCAYGATQVMGQFGPDSARDVGMLTVSDDGSIQFHLWNGPWFSGHGVAFRPASGWDIDADLHGTAGALMTVTGHLSC